MGEEGEEEVWLSYRGKKKGGTRKIEEAQRAGRKGEEEAHMSLA